ncbi:MAG: guanylate kinase [Gammaproteobacteria bacterium RBG_16_57_12]|nr:MAG: guanylate kinase [Gammaproteobacteria bacterium RBG_16_57_12]
MAEKIHGEDSGGTLYIISAPSGAGKSSLVNTLLGRMPDIEVSISHTTRRMRPGEQDGEHYHFIDAGRFKAMLAEGAFLEYAQVFDNYYGTSRDWVQERLAQGGDVILEIDWQGARQIREKLPDSCVSIFILPPSREALEQRLRDRNQDDEKTIARRMLDAVNEMSHYREYDFIILNEDFDRALEQFCAIVMARRLRRSAQARKLAQILKELLS